MSLCERLFFLTCPCMIKHRIRGGEKGKEEEEEREEEIEVEGKDSRTIHVCVFVKLLRDMHTV